MSKIGKRVFSVLLFVFVSVLFIPTFVKADSENEIIEKVEIEGINLNIKVGERPTLSARLTKYADDIKLDETFMSLNRVSYITTEEESSSDPDELIKDYVYYHIIDLEIKDGSNYIFDNNTKFYLNGVEKKPSYVSEDGTLAVIADESEKLIPENYVASAELDEDFAIAQNNRVNEILVKLIKEGKVKYKEDETIPIIEDAISNNRNIEIELGVSESMTKSQIYFYSEDFAKIDENIGEGYSLGAYYYVDILVFVDGYLIGEISEIDEPISITIPYPNGLPPVQNGYKRVWKILRDHNGVVDMLDGERTNDGISFINDKHSSFASIYYDEKVEETSEIVNPSTGDTVYTYIGFAIISVLIFICVRIKEIKL